MPLIRCQNLPIDRVWLGTTPASSHSTARVSAASSSDLLNDILPPVWTVKLTPFLLLDCSLSKPPSVSDAVRNSVLRARRASAKFESERAALAQSLESCNQFAAINGLRVSKPALDNFRTAWISGRYAPLSDWFSLDGKGARRVILPPTAFCRVALDRQFSRSTACPTVSCAPFPGVPVSPNFLREQGVAPNPPRSEDSPTSSGEFKALMFFRGGRVDIYRSL